MIPTFVQRALGLIGRRRGQLGHKNAAYSLQYAGITDAELQSVVDER